MKLLFLSCPKALLSVLCLECSLNLCGTILVFSCLHHYSKPTVTICTTYFVIGWLLRQSVILLSSLLLFFVGNIWWQSTWSRDCISRSVCRWDMAHLEAIGIKMKQIVLKIMLCFITAHVPFICIIHYTSFEMNNATFHSSYVLFFLVNWRSYL